MPRDPNRPPLGSWARTYAVVIVLHAIWIALLYLLKVTFPR